MDYDPYERRRRGSSEDGYNEYDSDEVADILARERLRPQAHVPRGAACQLMSNILARVTSTDDEHSFGGGAHELPILPGLTVSDFGGVSLPLRREQAEVLVEQCRAEEEDNVWTLTPQQVQMTSPEWPQGINMLSAMSADRLGFRGVTLRPVLTKVVILGEGGAIDPHPGTDDDSVVAKLLVQFPSEHSGGDVVVYDHQEEKRYDLGKAKGVAALKPQYVVYAADVTREVKDVTSGYLLLAVYSLCLPSGHSAASGTKPIDLLRMQLVEAMKMLKTQDDANVKPEQTREAYGDEAAENSRIALILSQSIRMEEIETKGINTLQGLDCLRFQLLQAANARLPPNKQLKFFITCFRGGYSAWGTNNNTSWYLLSGEKLGDMFLDWKNKLNFLNPDKKSLSGLTDRYYSSENFAIVGWPAGVDVLNSCELMGKIASIAAVLAETPVNTAKLRTVLNYVAVQPERENTTLESQYGYRYATTARNRQILNDSTVSLEFCQKLCMGIADLGDLSLVVLFLGTYFPRLGKKADAVPCLAALVKKFNWHAVGAPLKKAIDELPLTTRIEIALKLADALGDNPIAQTVLTLFAVENVRRWMTSNPTSLTTSPYLDLLWKQATMCQNPQVFRDVLDLVIRTSASLLGPVVDALAKYIGSSSALEHRVGLATLASKRRQLLLTEIAEVVKPFTWEMPFADFPDAAAIAVFLQGPKSVLEIQGFGGIVAARARADLLLRKIKAPLEITASGSGRNARVQILKTGGAFGMRTPKMLAYKSEVVRLNLILQSDGAISGGSPSMTGNKHPRDEREDAGPAA